MNRGRRVFFYAFLWNINEGAKPDWGSGGAAPEIFWQRQLTKINICIDIIIGKKFAYVNTFLYLCSVERHNLSIKTLRPPSRWAKRQREMKYSEKEIAARKQIAMAAGNFFVSEGFRHVTISMTRNGADVTLFLDFADEVIAAEQLSKPFMLDGASRRSEEGCTSAGDHYYYLTLEWL